MCTRSTIQTDNLITFIYLRFSTSASLYHISHRLTDQPHLHFIAVYPFLFGIQSEIYYPK